MTSSWNINFRSNLTQEQRHSVMRLSRLQRIGSIIGQLINTGLMPLNHWAWQKSVDKWNIRHSHLPPLQHHLVIDYFLYRITSHLWTTIQLIHVKEEKIGHTFSQTSGQFYFEDGFDELLLFDWLRRHPPPTTLNNIEDVVFNVHLPAHQVLPSHRSGIATVVVKDLSVRPIQTWEKPLLHKVFLFSSFVSSTDVIFNSADSISHPQHRTLHI